MAELENLAQQMAEVEGKNKALNDKINEIIYNKASSYKEKTLEVLRRNPDQGSPRGRRERQQYFGIPDSSDQRLNQVLDSERMTTNKALGNISRALR